MGFLLDFGFTQSISDRRLFHLTDEEGLLLIAGTFVDDFKVVVQLESKAAEINKAWEGGTAAPLDVDAAAREFFGLNYMRGGSVIKISCHKATGDLAEKLRSWAYSVPALGPGLSARRRCRRAPSAGSSPAPGPTTGCCPTRHFPGHAASWDSRGGSCVMPGLAPCWHLSQSLGG